MVVVVAMAGDEPVSSARVSFGGGTDFAGLWGGGTLAQWRGRGIYRALVGYRARLAVARGYRYVQVDASPESLADPGAARLRLPRPDHAVSLVAGLSRPDLVPGAAGPRPVAQARSVRPGAGGLLGPASCVYALGSVPYTVGAGMRRPTHGARSAM